MTQDLEQFDSLRAEVTQLVAPTLTIAVTDAVTGQAAVDTGKQVKAFMAQVEKKRKELVGPLNDRVKMINDYVKTITAPLERAESHIKAELSIYAAMQEKIRLEAVRKAEQERLEAEHRLAEERRLAEEQLREKQAAEAREAEDAVALFGSDEGGPPTQELAHKAETERLELEAKFDRERLSIVMDAKGKEFDANQSQIKNTRRNWKCEATDLGKVPREFLIISLNEKAVLAAARAGVKEIAGVRLWQEIAVPLGTNTYLPLAK